MTTTAQQTTKNLSRQPSITHKATLLVKPVAPTIQWFLEYQLKSNPNLAYVLPCDEMGHVDTRALSDDALNVYHHIDERDHLYTYKGIHKAESGGLPMIFVCACRTLAKFSRWKEPATTCLGCYTSWTWLDVINLPMAESEITQE